MKAYLDSVSQHKIDETVSELNTSFISERRRKESEMMMGGQNILDNIEELDDE